MAGMEKEERDQAMRILIADDSLVMRRLLEVTLKSWGYDVVKAADGAEAWAELEKPDAPQLAILDWIMPVHTGPELCARIRQSNREQYTYILLLTSKSQREDIVEGMGAGADDYITKPFDTHELEVRVRAGRRIIDLQTQLLVAQEALRIQATHDPLTACLNRGAVMDALAREIARSSRANAPLGVIMMDLDHFKVLNDTHGHAAGDLALQGFVNRVQALTRPYDSIGRYGGEEFLLVLPGCDETAVRTLSERIREGVASEPFTCGPLALPLSVSIGACAMSASCGASADYLLRCADEALYQAKRNGRNCFVVCRATRASFTDEPAPAQPAPVVR
jgi:two-component system, cell cycle response regulator